MAVSNENLFPEVILTPHINKYFITIAVSCLFCYNGIKVFKNHFVHTFILILADQVNVVLPYIK